MTTQPPRKRKPPHGGNPPIPDDRLSRAMRRDPDSYPSSYWRALDYEIERVRTANQPAMLAVDRDAFLGEIETDQAVSRELLRTVVRAFTITALRGASAKNAAGWHEVIQQGRGVRGAAPRMGLEDVRPTGPHMPVPPAVPRVPPVPPWAVMIYEKRHATECELEADLAYWQGLPVRLVEALVRAHLRIRLQGPDGETPEGRSRLLAEVRLDLWDAILDAVRAAPSPPTPSPLAAP